MPMMPATHRPAHLPSGAAVRRVQDERRRAVKPWRRWYSLAVWRTQIRPAQLAREPLCERCKPRGRLVEATVVNHVIPHRGVWAAFIAGPFESLCKPCHDRVVQREERSAARAGRRDG